MLRRTLAILMLTGFISLNYANNAFTNSEGSKQLEWEPLSAGPITTWTAPLCEKGKFVIQPFFFYNRTRGTFNAEGNYDSLAEDDKKYQYQQQLFMQYGFTDRLEIDGQIVYQENYIRQSGASAHARGWGDNYLFLRYCALEETNRLPHITGLLQLKIPTGKYQKLAPDKLGTDAMGATSGGGSYDPGLGIILTRKIKPFILHADAIYGLPQEVKVDGVKTEYGNYLNCDLGLEYFLLRGFNLLLEFNGFIQADKKEAGQNLPASDINYIAIGSGIGWSNEKIQTLLSYQRTLAGTNTDANDSLILTFVYTF